MLLMIRFSERPGTSSEVTKRHEASRVPERADMFAKAGYYLALPKPPDLEIDLSLGWKAVDRKANGETDFIGKYGTLK